MEKKGSFNIVHFAWLMAINLVPALVFSFMSTIYGVNVLFAYLWSWATRTVVELSSLYMNPHANNRMAKRLEDAPVEPATLDLIVIVGIAFGALSWPAHFVLMPPKYWKLKSQVNYGWLYFLIVSGLVVSTLGLFAFLLYWVN